MKYACEKCGVEFSGYIRIGKLVRCQKCRRHVLHKKNVSELKSLFDLSKRTISKILVRLNTSCSICGWNVASCDLHHIVPKKNGGSDDHTNLTCVCPNCHRAIHAKKLLPTMTLEDQIGDEWKKYYAQTNC